ncbi:MAG: M1 family aminopeptidase [Acidobacteriota bacterium]
MNLLLALIFPLLFAASVESGGGPAPVRSFDVLHYDVALRVDPPAGSISGVARLRIVARERIQDLDLDADSLSIDEIMDVARPPGAGRKLEFQCDSGHLHIHLQQPLEPKGNLEISIRYTAKPEHGIRFTPDQVFTAFHTEAWLPSIMDPDDRATFRLSLNLPAGMTVVSNGAPDKVRRNGKGRETHLWNEPRAYPAYLFGFAAGRLHCIEPRRAHPGLTFCAAATPAADLQTIFKDVPRMISFFAEKAGVSYPEPRFAEFLMEKGVPQEAAGYAVLPESYAADVLVEPREDWLVAHELAHSWWGNLVTCRTWSDFWLNEGGVTFLTSVWKEHAYGDEEYARERYLARRRYRRAVDSGKAHALVFQGWKTPDEAGGPIPYYKGALVLHFLRHLLGEEAFWDGFRLYTSRAASGDGLVTSDDLQQALMEKSGKDLSKIFDQWVYSAEVPRIVASHEVTPAEVIVHLLQKQSVPWTIPLQVAVETTTGRCVVDVALTRSDETLHIPVTGTVLSVRVDDGANLPEMVEHERSAEMLAWQAWHEPDAIGRAEAVVALDQVCGKTPEEPICTGRASFLSRRESVETSRLVRSVIDQVLGR